MYILETRGTDGQHIDDHSQQLRTASCVCLAIAVIGVLIRCFVRKWNFRTFALDDWFMVISLVIYTVLIALVIKQSILGIGKPSDTLAESAIVEAFKYVYVAEIFYNLATLEVKFAFTLFYLRILREPVLYGRSVKYLRNCRILLWGLATFITIFATVYGFMLIFQCSPVSRAWTQFAGTEGHCMSPKFLETGTYLHSAINGALDLLLAFLPVTFFWKMELRWRMKLSVIGVLCIGALASVATFIRFKYIDRIPGARFPDPTSSFLPLALWSVVEPGIALFAGGLVVSKPLFNALSRLIRRGHPQSDSTLHISIHGEKVDEVEHSHVHEPTGRPDGDTRQRQSSITALKQ